MRHFNLKRAVHLFETIQITCRAWPGFSCRTTVTLCARVLCVCSKSVHLIWKTNGDLLTCYMVSFNVLRGQSLMREAHGSLS